jgi:SAM-dependent methyltransferase
LVKILKRLNLVFWSIFFNPVDVLRRLCGIPCYLRNRAAYCRNNSNLSFKFTWGSALPALGERYAQAGTATGHYFWQDIWAAQRLFKKNIKRHVDVGSKVDSFIGHIIPFCKVTYIDIRPFEADIENLEFRQGSILDIPFEDNTISSLSCLHVIEHIGLGRYGDTVDPEGHIKAANELMRVLMPGGELLIGTPIGCERLCFDAHRVFDPGTIFDLFKPLEMTEFSLIDDEGNKIIEGASFDQARRCAYGCGLFVFRKRAEVAAR